MGSESPDHDNQPNGHPSDTGNAIAAGGEPQGTHLSRDGDVTLGDGGGEDDDDDGDKASSATLSLISQATPSTSSKKKRKEKPKKKTPSVKQSFPPQVPLKNLFPSGQYPSGEIQSFGSVVENTARTTAEDRYLARPHIHDDSFLNNYRKVAEVHRQVRGLVQDSVRPGQALTDIAVGIEDSVRALLDNAGLEAGQGLESGMGFPIGLVLNNCVAHYTPNPGQKENFLQESDVMKVDFGVHINGWIVDSAFTMPFDPVYDNLFAAVKDATNTGIKNAGVDVRISDDRPGQAGCP